MPRRSERLRKKLLLKNAAARNKIEKYIAKRNAQIKAEIIYIRRLQYAHDIYNTLYKNFYVLWTDSMVCPSYIHSAYLHMNVLRKNLHACLVNHEEQLSDEEMVKIQRLYIVFRKYRELYENEFIEPGTLAP
jgi:hypothetical protein